MIAAQLGGGPVIEVENMTWGQATF